MRTVIAVLVFACAGAAAAQPLTFAVTSDADAGPGSLRQAMLDANASCESSINCLIDITIAGPIHLQTALPVIVTRGPLTIDGPQSGVILDGSEVIEGSGLEIRATREVTLRDLAVESFPGDGVYMAGYDLSRLLIERCASRRNRFRGLSVQSPGRMLVISDSAFDDNGRSGMALWASGLTFISRTSCSRNGASGVFVWNVTIFSFGGTLNDNVQFGLAIVPGVFSVLVGGEIRGNGVRNVDWGLDGESPRGTYRVPDAPEVLSARYDSTTGITTVEGVLRSSENQYGAYEVHASSGELQVDGTAARNPANVKTVMIHPVADFPRPRELTFTIQLRDAPPGSYVSAWGTDYVSYPLQGATTETSRAIRVQ